MVYVFKYIFYFETCFTNPRKILRNEKNKQNFTLVSVYSFYARTSMLCQFGSMGRKKKLSLWTLIAIITITTGSVIYYEATKHYMHYYVLPRQTKSDTTKIIFLWTAMQNNYKEWSWGIGPEPNIEDCNDPSIDGRCLITTHVDLIDRADVILFSIQDIKQVSYVTTCICDRVMMLYLMV